MKKQSTKTEFCSLLHKNCIKEKCAFWLDACQGMERVNQKEGFALFTAMRELIQSNPTLEEEVVNDKGITLRNFLTFADRDYGKYVLSVLSKEKIVDLVLFIWEMDFTIPAKEEVSRWNVIWIDDGNDDLKEAIDEQAYFIRIKSLANIFRMLPSWEMVENIKARDMELGGLFERMTWWVFADLMDLDDKATRKWLIYVTLDQLALALKTSTEELKENIFKNMTYEAAKTVRETCENMGPVPLEMVEQAQNAILSYVFVLEGRGEIQTPDKMIYRHQKEKT